MAKTISGITMTGTLTVSGGYVSAGTRERVLGGTIKISKNTNTKRMYLLYRFYCAALGGELYQGYFSIGNGSTGSKTLTKHHETIEPSAEDKSYTIILQVAVQTKRTATESTSWQQLAVNTTTVEGLTTTNINYYRSQDSEEILASQTVIETQSINLLKAEDVLGSDEGFLCWQDQNEEQYPESSLYTARYGKITLSLYPIFQSLAAKAKVKVSGEWQEGDIKCKVNGEWINADAAYVKVGGEWVEIS